MHCALHRAPVPSCVQHLSAWIANIAKVLISLDIVGHCRRVQLFWAGHVQGKKSALGSSLVFETQPDPSRRAHTSLCLLTQTLRSYLQFRRSFMIFFLTSSRLNALPWQQRHWRRSPWWVFSVWAICPRTGRVRTRSSSRTIRVRTLSSSWQMIRASTTSATTTETSTHRHWTNWQRREWSWRTITSSPSALHPAVSSSLAGNSLTHSLQSAVCTMFVDVYLVFFLYKYGNKVANPIKALLSSLYHGTPQYRFVRVIYCYNKAIYNVRII